MQIKRPADPEARQAHHESWRQRLHSPLLFAALLVIPVVIIESSTKTHGGLQSVAQIANWVIWATFVGEFGWLLYTHPQRSQYLKTHFYDVALILATVPFVPVGLQGLRALRLLTVLDLAIVLQMAREIFGLKGVKFAGVITALVVFGGGAAFSLVENHHGGRIVTLGDGIWWAIVTITTVGYGDFYPVTLLGRIIGAVVMFTGIGFVATLTTAIANHVFSKSMTAKLEAHAQTLKHAVTAHFEHHAQLLAEQTEQLTQAAAATAPAGAPAAAEPHPELLRRLDDMSAQLAQLSSAAAECPPGSVPEPPAS